LSECVCDYDTCTCYNCGHVNGAGPNKATIRGAGPGARAGPAPGTKPRNLLVLRPGGGPLSQLWPVVDLFSGAGGMSCGFSRHPAFAIIGAADAQLGKPSAIAGSLGCNASYAANIGLLPVAADLATAPPADVCQAMDMATSRPAVLTACPPCTGFSRAVASNHVRDDHRNGLVRRIADYAAVLRPE